MQKPMRWNVWFNFAGGSTTLGGNASWKGDSCNEGLVRFGGKIPGHAIGWPESSTKFQTENDRSIPGNLVETKTHGIVVICAEYECIASTIRYYTFSILDFCSGTWRGGQRRETSTGRNASATSFGAHQSTQTRSNDLLHSSSYRTDSKRKCFHENCRWTLSALSDFKKQHTSVINRLTNWTNFTEFLGTPCWKMLAKIAPSPA